ncbi:MAG: ZIP family metal transporter [Candidatus Methanoplasma sp.]|jgi:zinc transporter ZupT|nr:ZIP family metal transporter [Candidatus Methanoplasma sp.]
MDVIAPFLICVILITIVSFAAAFVPMMFKATDKQIHLMIAFSAGVFLGVLFLMLLPEAIHESETGGFDEMDVMYLVLAGFLIMFVVDFLFKHYRTSKCDCKECMDHHSHEITSVSAFIGLSIHTCFDGLALATAFIVGEAVGLMIVVALCIHKAVEVFSLSSTFLLTGNRKRSVAYLTAFCLISPIAALISYFVLGGAESEIAGPAFAFSAGVFMFVTMLHMIPEAFHRRNLDIKALALLIAGLLIVVCVLMLMGSHAH